MTKDLIEGIQHGNHKPAEIAGYFLRNFEFDKMTYFKLNKLVYLAFGWGIPLLDTYLFRDKIIAKEKGPVIESIYEYFNVSNQSRFNMVDLSEDELKKFKTDFLVKEENLFHKVYNQYGKLSDDELSEITHKHKEGTPWSKVYNAKTNSIIDEKSIAEHYFNLNFDEIISKNNLNLSFDRVILENKSNFDLNEIISELKIH